MATIMEIREMKTWLDSLRDATQRGAVVGVMEATNYGLAEAKKNARANFTGRWGYRKTGGLLNSIFAGFDVGGNEPEGVVGVRANKGRATENGETKPYGRIQEYGGEIKPVKAKWLWQPLWDTRPSGMRFITPREFIARKRQLPDNFHFFPTERGNGFLAVFSFLTHKAKGKGGKARIEQFGPDEKSYPLFLLRKKSVIPARPYVGPAVAEAFKRLPGMVLKRIIEQQRKE